MVYPSKKTLKELKGDSNMEEEEGKEEEEDLPSSDKISDIKLKLNEVEKSIKKYESTIEELKQN